MFALRLIWILILVVPAFGQTPFDCPKQLLAPPVSPTKPLRLVATSVGRESLFTVGVSGDELFHLSDRAERIGRLTLSAGEFQRIELVQEAPREGIQRISTLTRSHSVLATRGLIALIDKDGDVHLGEYGGYSARVLLKRESNFAVDVALSDSDNPELVVFTTRGIYRANASVPELARRSLMKPVAEVPHLRGGVALKRDDYLVYNAQGALARVRAGRVEWLQAEVPGGIQSMAAYLESGRLRIWLIATDGKIWNNASGPLEPSHYVLPREVRPVQVTASAERMQPDSRQISKWEEGFLSSRRDRGVATQLERVLILGDNGQLYSPWSFTEEAMHTLITMPFYPLPEPPRPELEVDEALLDAMRGQPVPFWEVELRMQVLSKAGVLREGKGPLLRAWLGRYRHARYLGIADSGIADYLTEQVGVPDQIQPRLIFLDALPPSILTEILSQTQTEVQTLMARDIQNLLSLPAAEFLKLHSEGSVETESILRALMGKVRPNVNQEIATFTDLLHARPNQSLYEVIQWYLEERDAIWLHDFKGQNGPGEPL